MKRLTFCHVADLHIDSAFKGLNQLPNAIYKKIQGSTYRSFEKIINIVIERKVDFIVISGDLYNSENRSLKAQFFLRTQFEKLHKVGIPVFIIHGNHDHLGGNWIQFKWPENVCFFSQEVKMKRLEKNNIKINFYGFSYANREIDENVIDHYKRVDDADFHIGLWHGNVTTNKTADRYASATVKEILSKNFDYWALGHIHKRDIIHEKPFIIYPGNIQGLNKKEIGEKGCIFVELEENRQINEFVPTADIVWEQERILIDQLNDVNELIVQIKKVKEDLRTKNSNVLLSLIIEGSGVLHQVLSNSREREEIIEILNANEQEERFVWTVSIAWQTSPSWNREDLKKESHFFQDLLKTSESIKNTEEILLPLVENQLARKYLPQFSEEQWQELVKEAETIIIQELLNK